ncbi:hypothetical protein DRN32_06310, partial [Thermococci archaeon]
YYVREKSLAGNSTLISGSEVGNYTLTWEDDGTYHEITEASSPAQGQQNLLEIVYYFYNVTIPPNTTEVDIYFNGKWDDNTEDITISAWNFNYSRWDELPNSISFSTDDIDVNNIIENYSYYLHNGEMRIRLRDSEAYGVPHGTLYVDVLRIEASYLYGPYLNEIRGGGEVHVTNYYKAFDMPEERLVSNKDYCLNNQTLRKELLIEKCVNDLCWNLTKVQDIYCDWGCYNSECRRPPWIQAGIVFGLILIGIFVYFYFFRW